MLILGIESSCDETGAALITGQKKSEKVKLLSNVVASSLPLHADSGGIIPENAAREQIKFIIPVIKEAIKNAGVNISEIDAIAVTHGPGLIGSLLMGVETAKTLSYVWNKPLIPTNHLYGHIYANFIDSDNETNVEKIIFPAVGLIVSGGHTDLILINNQHKIKWLGGTRDDAAGEAMDKIGRLLGLPYPGGPHIEKAALSGNPNRFNFPKPLIGSPDFDFSFSGLKTAVLRETQKIENLDEQTISDICASFQKTVVDILVKKTIKAAQEHGAKSILLGGGVAANSKLRGQLQSSIISRESSIGFFVPPKNLCTDNGAMIASAAFYQNGVTDFTKVDANPNLYF